MPAPVLLVVNTTVVPAHTIIGGTVLMFIPGVTVAVTVAVSVLELTTGEAAQVAEELSFTWILSPEATDASE